jgi:hypothetical protein
MAHIKEAVFMSRTYGSTHGFQTMASRKSGIGPSPVPPFGALLLQRPGRRQWSFEHGMIGRHNPDLRERVQAFKELEAQAEVVS